MSSDPLIRIYSPGFPLGTLTRIDERIRELLSRRSKLGLKDPISAGYQAYRFNLYLQSLLQLMFPNHPGGTTPSGQYTKPSEMELAEMLATFDILLYILFPDGKAPKTLPGYRRLLREAGQ